MDEHEFGRLIRQYQQGEMPPEQQILLEEWLEKMEVAEASGEWTEDDRKRLKSKVLQKIETLHEGKKNLTD